MPLSRRERLLFLSMKSITASAFFFGLLCFALTAFFLGTLWAMGASAASFSPVDQVSVTPTSRPLIEPTLPAEPSQADVGAQVFWSYCMPCHGDQGQGLTDEFRMTYPPDHQDCWKSGCHGHRPYTNGFILPTLVPRLIGPGALDKFPDAAALYGFVSVSMPFQRPASLTSQQYYQIVAFLLRQNGIWNGATPLDASNASTIAISPGAATPVPPGSSTSINRPENAVWLILAGLGTLVIILFIILRVRSKTGK